MKNKNIVNLKKLLSQNSNHRQKKLVNNCLTILVNNHFQHYGISRVLTSNILEIYTIRSTYEHIFSEGFKNTLYNLRNFKEKFVCMYSFVETETHYTIFSDLHHLNLLGIISVRKIG